MQKLIKALEKNNFTVFTAKDHNEAKDIFYCKVLSLHKPKSLSWGDSMTMMATGIIDELLAQKEISILNTFDKTITYEEKIERRRQALLVDMFLTGSNAITKKGEVVNLDMIGNRTAAITFGPKNVVLFIGKNKIVDNLDVAFDRVKNIAAPLNAIRHTNFITPCQKSGKCKDCSAPQRLCNSWTITAKSFPKGRIIIILIDEELGL